MTALLDIHGLTFGRLTVIERASNTRQGGARWLCRCSCGSEVTVRSRELVTASTRSCGCLKLEATASTGRRNRRHVVSYNAAHRRLRLAGSATDHPCADCSEPAAEWSYDHLDPAELIDEKGRLYSLDPAHYVPRCRSCHRRFDQKLPTAV